MTRSAPTVSVIIPASATRPLVDDLQRGIELEVLEPGSLIGGKALRVARKPDAFGGRVPDDGELVGQLEQQGIRLELVVAHPGNLRHADGGKQHGNDRNDDGERDRHEAQQAADHEQHGGKQQSERKIEKCGGEVAGKELAADLELAEARDLRGERRPLGHRQRQVEHRRERAHRYDAVEAGGEIGDHPRPRVAQLQLACQHRDRTDCKESQRIPGLGGDDHVVDEEHVERQQQTEAVDQGRIACDANERAAQALEHAADESAVRAEVRAICGPAVPQQIDLSGERAGDRWRRAGSRA